MRPLKVSEVNNYIKKLFASDIILSDIEVEGEISNYNHHYSGHRYFSLKDSNGIIKCVMFKGYGSYLKTDLKEGKKIIAKGYISLYEKTGEYQLYIKSVEDQGIGELFRKFEELKNKLEKEGLFSEDLKKDIPKMPRKIGLVTSATGAAVEDMISVIHRRYPPCNILLFPTLVQGMDAPKQIIEGIEYLDKREDIDLIIVGRGGGSIDELFAFNDEDLARTIFKCNTPIISAVGHETDFTIADFVSDLRAPTPSAAAEVAVPNINEYLEILNDKIRRLRINMYSIIETERSNIKFIKKQIGFNSPKYKIQDKRQTLENSYRDLVDLLYDNIRIKREHLSSLDKELHLKNPSLGLSKGYGIITDENNKLVKSIEGINENDNLYINLKDGKVKTLVLSKEGGSNNGK